MSRYFIEVAYKGTAYHGFQKQQNAITVQSEVEKALLILYKQNIGLTGSSRTDSGVHALQNFFHFDTDILIDDRKMIYQLNSLLTNDIAVNNIVEVNASAHCRFNALSRSYEYHICQTKHPFLVDRSFYYPYQIDIDLMNEAASILFCYQDFTSFSKRNTQVKTFRCDIAIAEWKWVNKKDELVFYVTANRFLRGMVRGLVGTMLKVGRGMISPRDFKKIIEIKDCRKADFSVPPQGLFLTQVIYSETIWKQPQ